MESLTNVELNKIGLKNFFNKEVVVKFLDTETNKIQVTTAILTDYDEGEYDDDGNLKEVRYITLSSETDFDRIPLNDVKKIFLKK